MSKSLFQELHIFQGVVSVSPPKINFIIAESVLSGVGTFKEHGRSPMPLSKEDER